MSGASILAPDSSAGIGSIGGCVSAGAAVTQYAQAVATLVPAYYDTLTGPWANLKPQLATVVSDTASWPAGLCQQYSGEIPNLFIAYDAQFQAALPVLQQQQAALAANPDNTVARSLLQARLQSLLGQLQLLSGPLTALEPAVVAYANTLQKDHDSMATMLGQLDSSIPGAGTVIDDLQDSLQVGFFTAEPLGPCNAIVEIASSASVALRTALGQAPAVVPVALLQALLNQMITVNGEAGSGLSGVLEVWRVLTVKLQAVLIELQNAQGTTIGSVLQQLDIQDAAASWQQLAAFAQQCLNNQGAASCLT